MPESESWRSTLMEPRRARRLHRSRVRIALAVAATLLVYPALEATADTVDIDVGRGPVTIHIPSSYNPQIQEPLVLLLHGYTGTGAGQEAYMQFQPLSETRGFLYAHPDGTAEPDGDQFWNATDACCDGSSPPGVDDSGYLRALIDAIAAELNVGHVFLIGHSNGGFMSYRMACDHADRITAIASLAGTTFFDPGACTPSTTVHTLQIHGTTDETISYEGGSTALGEYPGAVATAEQWATYNGCTLEATPGEPLDLDFELPGAETSVSRYNENCAAGGSAELWTIVGGAHIPALAAGFRTGVIDFFLSVSQPRPPPEPPQPGTGDCPHGTFSVSGDGTVCSRRAYFSKAGSFNTGAAADLAERIDASEALEPGDLVAIDPEARARYRLARGAKTGLAVGVVTSVPAITLANGPPGTAEDSRPLLALMGRVPVKATAENGPIRVGDLLVSSSTPGTVMRCESLEGCPGALVGKALEALERGEGKIEVLLMR
jgi:polyhydroxybutyrate depolymerase